MAIQFDALKISSLATKDDCCSIKSELADISSDLKLMRWTLVAVVAGVIFLVAKAFF